MLILSLNTAGHGCGVCVWRDEQVLAQREEAMARGQDRRLLPLILEMIEQAGISFDALDRIAVSRGPGSFTGLRIGLAAAQGLGLATGKPVIGIDRFTVFRDQFPDSVQNLLVVIHSRRAELYCRFYPATGQAHEPAMLTLEEIAELLAAYPDTFIVGDVAELALPGFQPSPVAESVIIAALAALADADHPDFLPRPLYLRPPDVTMSAKV